MNDIYFVVSTNGNGLVVRQVGDNDTTVYSDQEIASFDTLAEANQFAEAHDADYYDDEDFYSH